MRTERLLRRAPWVAASLSVAVLAAGAVVGATTDPALGVVRVGTSDIGWWLAYVTFAIVGAVVAARRPRNPVGWLMLSAGAINAWAEGAAQYAVWGLVRHPGSLPGASFAAWMGSYLWSPSIAVLVLVLAYFPTGRLVSRRWRWLPTTAVLCSTVIVAVTAVDMWPRRGARLLATDQSYELHTFAGHVIGVLWPFIPICGIAAMTSIAVRYRRAAGTERQQLKWLVLAGAVSAPSIVIAEVVSQRSTFGLVMQVLNSPAWCAIAIAVAILRYRLYDIDRIVSRTVSYFVVTAVIVGLYVGAVAVADGVLGSSSPIGVAASTLVAAAAFQPVRRKVQHVVDRRFNREVYDARRTVDAFSARLRDEVDVEAVSHDLLATVERAVAPSTATLWLVRT